MFACIVADKGNTCGAVLYKVGIMCVGIHPILHRSDGDPISFREIVQEGAVPASGFQTTAMQVNKEWSGRIRIRQKEINETDLRIFRAIDDIQ